MDQNVGLINKDVHRKSEDLQIYVDWTHQCPVQEEKNKHPSQIGLAPKSIEKEK